MVRTTLAELLERNQHHTDALSEGVFDEVQDRQRPAAVAMCCSDSRVPHAGMWHVEEPGWLFTPSTIGNQVWDRHEDELVVDGSMLYPIAFTDTETAIVVGHTGCGAITAALDVVQGDGTSLPPGVAKWVELLVPVVEAGLDDERIDPHAEVSLVDQLVEYNVDRQVAFLLESDDVPSGVDVYGFVYDFQRVYGEVPGRAYLVNANDETALEALSAQVPKEFEDWVDRLLGPQ